MACKRAVYASVDLSIGEALKEEAYWLYQAMSKTPAQKRFQYAPQRNWDQLVGGHTRGPMSSEQNRIMPSDRYPPVPLGLA